MRLLQFWPMLLPNAGGMQVLADRLLGELARRGHEVTVICSRGVSELPEAYEQQGVRVHMLDLYSALERKDLRSMLRLTRRIAELKRELRPEVVHLHYGGPELYFHHATRADCAAPCLITLHNPLPAPAAAAGASLMGRLLREAGHATAVSAALLEEARLAYPELEGRGSVIHNGLPWPSLEPEPLNFTPPRLLCFGRLAPEKGFEVAITAFARLAGRHPDLSLTIAGSGAVRAALESQAQALGLGGRVEFVGWVAPDRVPELIQRAAIVLVPSLWQEPFGLVALEAAQMRRPVVASGVAGLREVVEDGVTGLLVQPGSAEALASAVERLLREPELARGLGEAGRRRALREFSMERCADGYEAVYARLIEAGDGA